MNETTDFNLSVPEAARRAGISERTLIRLLDTGKIAFRTPSKHRRVSESSLEHYLYSRDSRRQVRKLPPVENVLAS